MGSSAGNSWELRAAGMGEDPGQVEEGPTGCPESFQRWRRAPSLPWAPNTCSLRARWEAESSLNPERRDKERRPHWAVKMPRSRSALLAAAPQPAFSPKARAGRSWEPHGVQRRATDERGDRTLASNRTKHGTFQEPVLSASGRAHAPLGLCAQDKASPGLPAHAPFSPRRPSPSRLAAADKRRQAGRRVPAQGDGARCSGPGRSRRGLPGSGRTPAPPGSRPDSG